ncbi:hypothetical protein CHS0354_023304 [Potamilus streckersoni]|uniref:Uncharacterized protein n=1 Tax=Potamilus streckersoni TaxID=2493646 RepID=A0AAE0T4N1_9BIVA|nr:hypothetical protein CHS0354_023304 [Potamilus streckersoni]
MTSCHHRLTFDEKTTSGQHEGEPYIITDDRHCWHHCDSSFVENSFSTTDMKLIVVFTACMLLSCSNAGFFDSLKQSFAAFGQSLSAAFQPVLDMGKTLGSQLLANATQTGSTLAGQALSALAQTFLASTQGKLAEDPAQTSPNGKRDILELLQNLHLAKNQLDQALSDKFGNLNNLFHAGVDSLRGVLEHAAQQASTLDLNPAEVVHQIESIVATHNGLVDHMYGDVIKTIVEHMEQFALNHGGNKRSVSDILNGLGSALTQFFQPHLDSLKQTFSGLGTSVSSAVNQFQEPGNDLVSHAHALVDALQQTFVNALPHVLGVLNSGGQILSAAATNLANTLGQQTTTSP